MDNKVNIRNLLALGVLVTTLISVAPTVVFAEPSAKRIQAMDILHRAYSWLHPDNNPDGVDPLNSVRAVRDVERALALDPEFAYAHIARAGFALQEGDWQTAILFYEKGIKLTSEPDQIYSPVPSIEITAKEVVSQAQPFVAYAYVMLARDAFIKGDEVSGLTNISMARIYLEICLASNPDPETKVMAEELLASISDN